MLNLFRFVGIRHLKMKPVRSALTTLGVALGVGLFTGIQIINHSTIDSFKENIESVAGKATLSVSTGETGFPEERLEEIQKIEGVKYAVPMIEARGYFVSEGGVKLSSQTLMVLGVDLLKEQSVRTYKTVNEETIDDPLVFLNQPDSIIITHDFAKANGFKMGSTFSLATTHGRQTFTVRGLLSPSGPAKAYGGAIAIMDIDGARATFGKVGKLDRVDIVTRDGSSLEDVASRIRNQLGVGYQVDRPMARSEEMERMVKSYQTMMTFFSSLALFVGLFLISNSISISVAERRKEIGVLRALGATRKKILILFLSEALAMGSVGAFVGAWMGKALAMAIIGRVSQTMSAQYLTSIQVTHLKFGMEEILRSVSLGGGAALLAAAWPAYRATAVQPLEAMRRHGTGIEAMGPNKRSYLSASSITLYAAIAMLVFVNLTYALRLHEKFRMIENFNELFSVLGATLLGPTIVAGLVRFIRPLSIRFGGPITRLAQDNLIRNPKRTGSNVMSLMVGLILVVLIAAVNVSFKSTLMNWFSRVFRFDMVVSSTGQVVSFQTQPLEETLARELEQVPGIKRGPKTGAYGFRFVHVQYAGKPIGLKAYDEPDPVFKYSTIELLDRPVEEAGYELFHTHEPAVFVSENFVLHFHKKTGDTLDLDTPGGKIQFKILGVMVDFASDNGVLYMNRDIYKVIWKDTLVSGFGIQAGSGMNPEKLREEIDRRFGLSKNIMVTSSVEMKKQMTDLVDQSFADSRSVEVAALLVGLLGLLNTLLISVMERMREIGMLRALGMTRKQVTAMILQEAFFQCGFGALAAIVLGAWLAYVWITQSLSFVLGWIVHFYFPWSSILTTMATALSVAWIASYYPAKKAAHLEIAEALEYE